MPRAVLEVTRTSLRWLLVEGSAAAPRVRAFRVIPLSQELTAAVVRQAAGGATAGRVELISAIPRDQLLTRLLKLPSVDTEELAGMVDLNGKTQLPYPPEQTVCDFQVIEQRDGVSTVHLVAAHRDMVDRHVAALRQAGLDPSIMTPSSWGVVAWYERWGKSAATPEPALVVNVDADHTDVVLIRQGRVLVSRSLSQGSRDWDTTDGPALLGQELELTLAGLRKELPGVEAASWLLTGVGPLESWSQALSSRLGRPVTPLSPAVRLRLPDTVSAQQASPVVALGLALGDQRGCPNLLPAEARGAQTHRQRMRLWKVTGVLWVASLIISAAAAAVMVQRQERANAQLMDRVRELESVTRQTEAEARLIRLLNRIVAVRQQTAGGLAELFRATPPDILFESVTLERSRGELVVRGNAPSTRDVLAYLHQLEQAGLWQRVELRYSAHRSGSEGERTDFEILITERHEEAS